MVRMIDNFNANLKERTIGGTFNGIMINDAIISLRDLIDDSATPFLQLMDYGPCPIQTLQPVLTLKFVKIFIELSWAAPCSCPMVSFESVKIILIESFHGQRHLNNKKKS